MEIATVIILILSMKLAKLREIKDLSKVTAPRGQEHRKPRCRAPSLAPTPHLPPGCSES